MSKLNGRGFKKLLETTEVLIRRITGFLEFVHHPLF
jgi:hypothetical protein